MSKTDNHKTTTELWAGNHVDLVRPDRVHSAPNTYQKIHSSVSVGDRSELRCRSPAMRGTSPFARPNGFPIRTHGFPEGRSSLSTQYRVTYRLRFGVDFWLSGAQQVAHPCNEVLVRELPAANGKPEPRSFLGLRHPNIHAILDTFDTEKTRHIVFEHMEVSLHEIATVGINTVELASILKQVIDGLVYISEQGLEHGSLTCSNVLVSKAGTVKIAQCERCRPRAAPKVECKPCDVVAFKSITVQMMGGHIKPEGAACLPDPKRWYHEAAAFLAHTTSAISVGELQNHEFLELSCMPEQLKSVVSRVIRTARIHLEDMPDVVQGCQRVI